MFENSITNRKSFMQDNQTILALLRLSFTISCKKKKKVEKWNHLLEAFCEMFEAIFQKLDSLG